MTRWRIAFKKAYGGLPESAHIRANKINGLKDTSDTYVFKRRGEVVFVVPKCNVRSIEQMRAGDR